MNYNKNFENQLNNLRKQIRNCKEEEFNSLVYKYNFYQSVNNAIKNEMIEIKDFKDILNDESIFNRLYDKFMNSLNVPSMVDESVVKDLLQDIDFENRNKDLLNNIKYQFNMSLIDKIADIFCGYFCKDNSTRNSIKQEILQEIKENEIPYKVLQHLYNLYEDSKPRCNESYIQAIKDVLFEAEDYYFEDNYNRDTIKYLIYQDIFLKAYNEYQELKNTVQRYNTLSLEEEREKIVENIFGMNYTTFKKNYTNTIMNEYSVLYVQKKDSNKLEIDNLIDIYDRYIPIDSDMPLEKLFNIVEDYQIYQYIEELKKSGFENQNKIEDVKSEFKEFKFNNDSLEKEETEEI